MDTGADATYLHPHDGLEIGIPFDLLQDRITSSGIGGVAAYFPEPAILLFSDDAVQQRYGYRINVNIARLGDVGDRLPSLLGRNVIRRWRMDYDPTAGRLEFTAGMRTSLWTTDDCIRDFSGSSASVSVSTAEPPQARALYCAYPNRLTIAKEVRT